MFVLKRGWVSVGSLGLAETIADAVLPWLLAAVVLAGSILAWTAEGEANGACYFCCVVLVDGHGKSGIG